MKNIQEFIAGLKLPIVLLSLILMASCQNNTANQSGNSNPADSAANARRNDSLNKKTTSDNPATGNTHSAGDSATDNQHIWTLVITPSSTKNNLDSICALWKKENISLVFSKLIFDSGGNLTKIKGTVDITTKAGNHANGEFKSENLASLQIKVDDSPNVTIKGN